MDKCELKKRICDDAGADCKILNKLHIELNKELQKTFKKRDFDKIERLTQLIRKLTEDEDDIKRRTENGIYMLKEKGQQNNIRTTKFHFRKVMAGLCMCFAAVIAVNFVSMSTRGTNILSSVVEFTEDAVLIDFKKQNRKIINLPASLDDPYGMKAKCAELGLYPETPSYIPEGFDLVDVVMNEMKACTVIIFYYENGGKLLSISYELWKNLDEMPPVGIPSDTHNVIETEINNLPVYIMKEDNQFTATYMTNDIVHFMACRSVSYDECQKVLESFC